MDIHWIIARTRSYLPVLEKTYIKKEYKCPPLEGFIWDDNNKDKKEKLIIKAGSKLGGGRRQFEVTGEFHIPVSWQGDSYFCLELGRSLKDTPLAFLYGPEALAFIEDGDYFGIDPYHTINKVPRRYEDGKTHILKLIGWTGIEETYYTTGPMTICQLDENVRDLIHIIQAILDLYESHEGMTVQAAKIISIVHQVLNKLDLVEPLGDSFYISAERCFKAIKQELASINWNIGAEVIACGHGHLDIAWLWTTDQGRIKAAQTFSNALCLMEDNASFCFSQTQAQLYAFILHDYPQIFLHIKEKIAEGRWELLGRSWVEFDCNITGAESLVRQFLLGYFFYKTNFGTGGSPVLWLPDTFGFCGQLPQLMKSAEMEYFSTAKLTWNAYNQMPHDSFIWRGIDGTEVLAHIVTTAKQDWWGATYSADLSAKELLSTVEKAGRKGESGSLLIPYGRGDGGGGPNRDMLRRIELFNDCPGLPKVETGFFIDYFRKLEKNRDKLPTWDGELYFELHRGTYTSQGHIKKENRECENLLHNAEFFAVWASQEASYEYPHESLQKAWELLCLNQFHDILPGSSIGPVYKNAAKDYGEIRKTCVEIIDESLGMLSGQDGKDSEFTIYNSTPFIQNGICKFPFILPKGNTFYNPWGNPCPSCSDEDGTLVYLENIPSYGFAHFSSGFGVPASVSEPVRLIAKGKEYILENGYLKVVIDHEAYIISIIDKTEDRELIPPGKRGGVWQLFEDRPADWEAWDIDEFYAEKPCLDDTLIFIRIEKVTPLRCVLSVCRMISKSEIITEISLDAESRMIRFHNQINWQERRVLLKLAFPLNIMSNQVRCDIQWGNITRPTRRNTSWDRAMFEICAHKWVDISEGNYGVSLLNNCKYGHDVHNNIIRLSILKGPMFPDLSADLGMHEFDCILYPHKGTWQETAEAGAYLLNNPLIIRPRVSRSEGRRSGGLFSVDGNFVVETIKMAENHRGIIVRGYESRQTRGKIHIKFNHDISAAFRCNILENNLEQLAVEKNVIAFIVHPYEIVTLNIL
jgi:alpha-mannosidase